MDGTSNTLQRGRQWNVVAESVRTMRPAMVEHANRYSLCRDDAEDALQLATEKLLTRAPQMPEREIRRWMFVVVRNEALSLRRRRRRLLGDHATDVDEDESWSDPVDLIPARGPSPEESVAFREMVGRAGEALRAIKPDQRRALGLLGEGYSYAEIQSMTGWSHTKVNRLLAEGRKRFRQLYTEVENGDRCEQLAASLSRFCDGEAAEEERRTLATHLRTCANCRSTLASYRAAPRAAALLPAVPPGGGSLVERAQEALAAVQSRFGGRGGSVTETVIAHAAGG
ncbi:MAG TPA: sigma-70 family RNA polymerase sigma factor, partial [Solirubrobacterales bacterium]|nr:sigma-70 family RNA polymerase sigma factor [Solirubrobacterales bacterium]